MFAVPGWNLSREGPVLGKVKGNGSSDTVQSSATGTTAIAPAPAPTTANSTSTAPDGTGRKRKRDGGGGTGDSGAVNGENLGRLWNKHFGGDPVSHSEKKEKKEKKNQKKNKREKKDKEVGEAVNGSSKGATESSQRNGSGPKVDTKTQAKKSATRVATESGIGVTAKPKKEKRETTGKQRFTSDAEAGGQAIKPEVPHKSKTQPPAPPPLPKATLTPLQQSMRAKLISARFRHLNETLYTADSSKALSMFSESPELFSEYHAGFSQQVKEAWPENPVELYIKTVKSRANIPFKLGKEGKVVNSSSSEMPLPRRPHGTSTIADLGCGDAQLARGLQSSVKHLNLKFYNFDLHAASPFITKADIANLPLKDGEVDVAVFCLSLMGTNWISFVEEAWRVLRGDGRGEIWVAEVKSRFGRVPPKRKGQDGNSSKPKKKKQKQLNRPDNDDEDSLGEEVFAEVDGPTDNGTKIQDETDITGFVEVFQRRGFSLRQDSVVKNNKMFVSMIFTKAGVPVAGKWKGMKWVGTRYERVDLASGKTRFLEAAKEGVPSPEEERKVLKPCVYKIR